MPLSSFIGRQTEGAKSKIPWSPEWKPQSQKTNQKDHNGSHPCVTQWSYKPWHARPPKTEGSLWRVLTKCGLPEGMANHFSILALRTPETAWKGKKIGHWNMSPRPEIPYISEIIWHLSFYMWPISHSIMRSRSTHVVSDTKFSFFLWLIFHFIIHYIFFIHFFLFMGAKVTYISWLL